MFNTILKRIFCCLLRDKEAAYSCSALWLAPQVFIAHKLTLALNNPWESEMGSYGLRSVTNDLGRRSCIVHELTRTLASIIPIQLSYYTQ